MFNNFPLVFFSLTSHSMEKSIHLENPTWKNLPNRLPPNQRLIRPTKFSTYNPKTFLAVVIAHIYHFCFNFIIFGDS